MKPPLMRIPRIPSRSHLRAFIFSSQSSRAILISNRLIMTSGLLYQSVAQVAEPLSACPIIMRAQDDSRDVSSTKLL